MTMMDHPIPLTPDPALLAGLLQDGPSAEVAARLLPGATIPRLTVERVHFPANRPLQLQIRADQGDGRGLVLLGEWVGDRAQDMAGVEAARLAKPRRGQGAGGPSVVADAASGLVLRRPGFDAKLPGLRLLHDPDWAQAQLSALGLDPASTVTLVAHRLGKRAVLRISGAGGILYARLRPVTSASGVEAYDRHFALWSALQGAREVSVPQPLGYHPHLGLALFAPLPGTPPVFRGLDGFRAVASAMRALAALQATKVPAPAHTTAEELDVLNHWAGRVAQVLPDLAPDVAASLSRLRAGTKALSRFDPVLCHRDLHEGQILQQDGVTGLLDFDTLRTGDPGLDAGNLQAHLILAGLRDGRSRRTFVTAIDTALPSLPLPHIAWWRRAALLRLAMIYAFSSEPRGLIHALLAEVA